MKKIFTILTVFVLSISANAQLVTSTSSSLIETETPKERLTTWIIRVGMGTNAMAGEDFDVNAKLGYYVGFEFNRKIGQKGAYWGQDYGFASRGYKVKDKIEYSTITSKMTAHTLQISPFIFGWKIKLNEKFSLDPHVGFYYAYDMAGKFTSEYKDEKDEIKISDVDDYFRHDIGIKFGIGLWSDKFIFDITYQRGAMSHLWDDVSGGPSNILFRAGFAL